MALERTLSIVKPDGVKKNVIGDVYQRFEKAGLRIVGARIDTVGHAVRRGVVQRRNERLRIVVDGKHSSCPQQRGRDRENAGTATEVDDPCTDGRMRVEK